MDEKDESRWIIGIIEDGIKSDYWKLLKQAINEWITEEHKRLNYYKQSGIHSKDEMDKYNRTVDRLKYLNKLLTINETIVEYHKSWLDKVKEKAEEYLYVGESLLKGLKRGK